MVCAGLGVYGGLVWFVSAEGWFRVCFRLGAGAFWLSFGLMLDAFRLRV